MSYGLRGGEELAKLSRELRALSNGKEIRSQMRKQLRSAALPMVPAVRASIKQIPSQQAQNVDSLRARLSKATRLRIYTVGQYAGVAVLVDPKKMPPGQGSLPALVEGRKRPWRHPVFGNTGTWVTQKSHPFFYRAVAPYALKSRLAVNRVLDDITKRIT